MTVSVIIPFYNLAGYVRECLDSVFAAVGRVEVEGQRSESGIIGFSVEVICVDDGSTDGTGAVLDEYASNLQPPTSNLQPSTFNLQPSSFNLQPVLKLIHQINSGVGNARNAGLAVATGEWVTFLDGDDVWLPNMLTSFAGSAGRHPDVDLVGLRFAPFGDGRARPLDQAVTDSEVVYDLRESIPSKVMAEVGVFPTFFRRSVFSEVSFEDLPIGEDRLFVAQCLAKAKRIVMSSAVVHGYRLRDASAMHSEWTPRKVESLFRYASGSLMTLANCGKRVEGGQFMAFLGNVLLAEAPKNCVELKAERTEVWRKWINTVLQVDEKMLVPRHRRARRLLLALSGSENLSLLLARILRSLGVTK